MEIKEKVRKKEESKKNKNKKRKRIVKCINDRKKER